MIYYFYKIVCDDLPDYVYVGSTRAFTNRKYKHKSACENINGKQYNFKIYQTIRANGNWDNWKMICIHQQDVENRRMAEKIEEDFRLELKATLNAQRAFLSEEDNKEYYKEYYEINKEQMKEYGKEWRENNKEYKKEYASEKITCVCGCQIRRDSLAQHKRSQKHIKLMENI